MTRKDKAILVFVFSAGTGLVVSGLVRKQLQIRAARKLIVEKALEEKFQRSRWELMDDLRKK